MMLTMVNTSTVNLLSRFLPRDARQSAIIRLHVVRPSVTFRYRDQIGWNSSKIISRPNSLRPMRSLRLTWAIDQLGLNRSGVRST